MEIKRFEAGQLLSNGYVVYDREGGDCWLIDTGYEPDNFIEGLSLHIITMIILRLDQRWQRLLTAICILRKGILKERKKP